VLCFFFVFLDGTEFFSRQALLAFFFWWTGRPRLRPVMLGPFCASIPSLAPYGQGYSSRFFRDGGCPMPFFFVRFPRYFFPWFRRLITILPPASAVVHVSPVCFPAPASCSSCCLFPGVGPSPFSWLLPRLRLFFRVMFGGGERNFNHFFFSSPFYFSFPPSCSATGVQLLLFFNGLGQLSPSWFPPFLTLYVPLCLSPPFPPFYLKNSIRAKIDLIGPL